MSKSISSISQWRIIWCSIGLGVLYWFIDCLMDVYIFKEGTLTSQIFSPYPHEIWMRLLTMSGIIFIAALAQLLINSKIKSGEQISDIALQWQTTFNAMNDAIFIADAEGKILRCNNAFANLVNKQESEIVGHTCHEVVHGTAYFIDGCPFTAAKDTHKREVVELEAGNKWFSVTVDPVLNDSGEIVSYVHAMSDITERKLAEQALKESEEKYKSVIENVGVGISVISQNMEILSLNSLMKQWFPDIDTSKKPICYKVFNNPPREDVCSYCPTCKTLIDGETHESITDTPVGNEIRNYRVVSSPIRNAEGKVIAAIEMVDDITESRRAGEKLHTSEERFRSLAENIDQVFWFTELNPERVLYVSPAFERIWGVPAEDLYSNPRLWVDLIHKDDRQHMHEAFEAFISSGGKTPYKVEYRIKKQDDEIRWIYDRGTFIPTKEGQPQRISGVAEDITERKQVQEKLEKTTHTLQSIFQASPVAILVLNTFGQVTMWSPAAEHIFGWKAEEVLGRFNPIVPEEKKDEFKSHRERILSGESFTGVEVKRMRKDGSYLDVMLSTAPVYDQNGRITGIIGMLTDITEKKKAEEALRESEENLRLYQTLIDQSYDSVEVVDPETGCILNVNKKTCADLGYSREELLSMKVFDIDPMVKPSDFPKIMEELRRTGGGVWNGVHLRKDGSTFPVEVSLNLVQLDRCYIVAVARDMTERKKSEEALREKELLLSDSQQIAHIGSWKYDMTGRITWSDETYRIYGVSPNTFTPTPESFINLIHPDDRPAMQAWLNDCLSGGKPGELEFRSILPDGTVRFIMGRGELKYDAENRPTYMSGTAQDITERKKMDEQIFQIKQDWEDTFNILTDMITVHDADFNIIRYNTAAEKILGLSFLNIKKEKCYQFYHGTECAPAGCPSCLTFKTGVLSTVELFEPHLNMFIEIRAIPRLDSEHKIIGLIHVVRDITEHKKFENHIRQSQKMEAVGQLAGGVAHDFNNIITAIIGYASVMKMKAGEDESLRGLIDQVLSASEKAANLVRSLLAFSRKQISNPEPVKINEIIKSIEKLLSMSVGEDIELKIELTEDLIVTADIVQMEQVMMNLCSNARDAISGKGTITIKTGAVELTRDFITAHGYGEEGRYALIAVSDTGVGMEENIRERIFEPFFTTKAFGKGTGLGLSIAYGIIKQHNGYITCQSEPGKGATFNIYLPVFKPAMEEIKSLKLAEPAGSAGTILFAEDEGGFRKLTRQMLESSGYNVIEAFDGLDAVDKFKENNDIDLLLFDIIMPRLSGKEAYDRIRKIRPDVKVLFISGYPADFTSQYGALEEGMNFISKPVMPAALLRKIIEIFGNERAE
ncbi:MAG: PAS domain S-box protein [Nitrospirae bacterium]|nr:PAS domain S-box protein [Nitrospirota bacterium]